MWKISILYLTREQLSNAVQVHVLSIRRPYRETQYEMSFGKCPRFLCPFTYIYIWEDKKLEGISSEDTFQKTFWSDTESIKNNESQ